MPTDHRLHFRRFPDPNPPQPVFQTLARRPRTSAGRQRHNDLIERRFRTRPDRRRHWLCSRPMPNPPPTQQPPEQHCRQSAAHSPPPAIVTLFPGRFPPAPAVELVIQPDPQIVDALPPYRLVIFNTGPVRRGGVEILPAAVSPDQGPGVGMAAAGDVNPFQRPIFRDRKAGGIAGGNPGGPQQ